MRWPAWSRDWRILAGGAGLLGGLAWLLTRDDGPTVVGAPASLDLSGRWVELAESDTVRLVRGVRYRACVRVSSFNLPVRALLSVDRVRTALEEKGFSAVRVASGSTPPNWDNGVDCFRYVDATWDRPDQDFERPSQVRLAWRWEPNA